MALEDSIIALTKAVEANTAALAKVAGAAKAATTGGGGAGAPKPAAKAATKVEDVQKAYAAYLSVTDEDERNLRKAKVLKINEHFGVTKITAVDPSKYGEALEVLKKVEAGEMFADDEAESADESLV
jgi:hypothetical protein